MALDPRMIQALLAQMGAVGAGGNAPTSASVNGGGGVGGGAVAGGGNALLNRIVGATAGGNMAGLGSEGALGAGQDTIQNPQSQEHAMDALTDLTAGVGDQPGTVGYSSDGQNKTDNPAGPLNGDASMGNGAFEIGGNPSGNSTMPTGPNVSGSASFGRDLNQLIAPGNKASLGYAVPKRLTNNLQRLDAIFPQTGLQPFRGPLG